MKKIFLTTIAVFLFISISFAGGPWPQPQGKGYFKLTQWWTVFDQHYTDMGLIDPNVTSGIFNTSIYVEYGFTKNLTGVAYLPFFSRNYMNNLVSGTTGDILVPGDAINSLGDADLGIKYAFPTKLPLAATLTFGLPLGQSVGGELDNLQTGDGEFNQMLQIDAGAGFNVTSDISFYMSTMIGVNNRTKGFSDEFRYSVEGGFGFLDKKLWLIGRLLGVESFKNGETAGSVTSTSIFANNSEHLSYSVEAAAYVYKKIGISASYTAPIRGEIISANPAYSVGVFYDLK